MKLTEKEIINKYLRPLTYGKKEALKLEDDIFYDNQKKIIFSTDTYEENIHFLNSSHPSKFIKKIFRSSISDIICKGCSPFVYFLSLSLKKTSSRWLSSLRSELKIDSKRFKLFLGGGDTIKSKKNSFTFSILGHTQNSPILRNGAKIGDDIYVTGNLGDSFIGLSILYKKKNLGKQNNYFKKIYLEPNLQFTFSKQLYKFANSSIDISDGLIIDLKNICKSSKCGAIITYENIPFSINAIIASKQKKIKLIDIFSRGDDYQILFTANKNKRNLIQSIAKKTLTKVSRVGKIIPKKLVKLSKSDKFIDLTTVNTGYIHKF